MVQSFKTSAPTIRASGSINKTEHASALEYMLSMKSLDRTLKFFHIPKTAGTGEG